MPRLWQAALRLDACAELAKTAYRFAQFTRSDGSGDDSRLRDGAAPRRRLRETGTSWGNADTLSATLRRLRHINCINGLAGGASTWSAKLI